MKLLPTNFYSIPHIAKMTMTRKDLKELLLESSGWIMACGKCYDIKSKNLGAGVYQVFLKKKTYD